MQDSSAKIVLIEDHLLFAQSMEIALSLEGFPVRRVPVPIAGATRCRILAKALACNPAIALLDLDLGNGLSGDLLVEPLVQAGVTVGVITGSESRRLWGECLSLGAATVVSKAGSLNSILDMVHGLAEGRSMMDPGLRAELIREWERHCADHDFAHLRLAELTARESEVLAGLMRGYQARDIARISVVSEATVRTQIKAILAKLQVSSQLAAVGLAHELDWTPPTYAAGPAGTPPRSLDSGLPARWIEPECEPGADHVR